MKKLIAILFLLTTICKAQTLTGDEVLGTWLTGSGKAKVLIYKNGDKYFGKIVWLKIPTYEDGTPKVDKNNPDAKLQKVPLMGLNMLKGFTFNKTLWENGTIYDPENGKTYSCKINYRDGKLDVRGFVGISLLGRTDTWFKTADIKQ